MTHEQRCVRGVSFFSVLAMAAAADMTVPADWNVAPMTNGAAIETFETGCKVWMTNSAAENAIVSNPCTDTTPTRANDWFGTGANALKVDTCGGTTTNTLGSGGLGYVDVSEKPVFLDMLVRFDPFGNDGDIDSAAFSDVKLAVYVTQNGFLACRDNSGVSVDESAVLAADQWYRVTVKLQGSTFQVFKNDSLVSFGGKTEFTVATNAGEAGKISQMEFFGSGHVDNLYASYGDPAYAVAGATVAPNVALAATDGLSVTNVTRINRWLAENKETVKPANVGGGTTVDERKCVKAYLLDEPGKFAPAADGEAGGRDVGFSMGITAIDVLSARQVVVTVELKVDDAAKTGAIRGKLTLEGKKNASDASYTVLDSAGISGASFTDGLATCLFTLPEGGYHIFNPVITTE